MLELPQKPRFRNDLVAQPIEEDGIRYVDVTDPESGNTFRFYDVEYSIACAMDGQRDLQSLAEWTQAELGIDTSPDELANVVGTLKDLGYLETGDATGAETGDDGTGAGVSIADALARTTGEREAVSPPAESAPAAEVEDPESAPAISLDDELSFADVGEAVGASKPNLAARPPEPPPTPPAPPPDETPMEALNRKIEESKPIALPPTPPKAGFEDEGSTQLPPPMVDMVDDEEDVSVDLSQHLAVGKDDVREAVRASQVMDVPEIPDDLKEAAESAEPTPEPPEPLPPPPGTIALADKAPAVKPIEPSRVPRPSAPKKSGAGWILVVVLFVVAAGLGGWYLWQRFQGEGEGAATSQKPAGEGGATRAPKTPAGPPAGQVRVREPVSVEARALSDGALGWTVPEGAVVGAGDPIAKLDAAERVERDLEHYRQRLEHYSAKLERGIASGNEGVIAAAQRKVDEKKGLIAEAEKALEELTIKAPAGGQVQLLFGSGAQVKKGEPVARIGGGPPEKLATFTVTEPSRYEAGAECKVAPAENRAAVLACEIAGVTGRKVEVKLDPDADLPDGAQVLLVEP